MSTYAIGDLQGCYLSLQALLAKIEYDPDRDRLLVVGDLVNRGPRSLECLRWAYEQGESAIVVLGNHDLHLLARVLGGAKAKGKDTLDDILSAPDRDLLIAWLRRRPLIVASSSWVVAHAGVLPQWTLEQALDIGREIEAEIHGDEAESFFQNMYGGEPCTWSPELEGHDKLRFGVNVFTRMRMLTREGALDLKWKDSPADAPQSLLPWFDYPNRRIADRPIITGHWSALGLVLRPDVWALDTGCVWGGKLTAVRLEDLAVFQVPNLDGAIPLEE